MTAILSDGQAFALRVWTEDLGAGGVEWRAKVRHLPSGETRYFRDWQLLLAFLRSKAGTGPEPVTGEATRKTE